MGTTSRWCHNTTVLRSTGSLITGSQTFNYNTSNEEFALIGNPYQANVDGKLLLNSAGSTGLSNNFLYVYDPNLNERGAYVTVDLSTESGAPTPSISAANKYVQPGQAFFVQATGPSSIRFEEQFKAVQTPSLTVFNESPASGNIQLSIGTSEQALMDELKVVFDDVYNDNVNNNDALKFYNQDETIGMMVGESLLSIQKRTLPTS